MIFDHKADSLLELLKTVYSFCIGVCVWLRLWLPLACNQFYDDFFFGIIASIMLSVYMDLNVLCYFWYIRNARDYWFDNTINVSMTITWISVRMIKSVGIYHFRFLHQYEIHFKFPILRPIVYPFCWFVGNSQIVDRIFFLYPYSKVHEPKPKLSYLTLIL